MGDGEKLHPAAQKAKDKRIKTVEKHLDELGIEMKRDTYEDEIKEKSDDTKSPDQPRPAKGPEQIEEKKLTDQDLNDLIQQALAENPPSRLQLNHLIFQIPPEQIHIQHEIKNVSIGVLRASNTQKVRSGHGFVQVSFPLTFTSRAAVNDELVPLLYMLRKTPFCWVHNEFLRKVLLPENTTDAMVLTLQSVTVQSAPNLPTTFQAVLQFLWFNWKPYTKRIQYRKYYNFHPEMVPEAFGPEAFLAGSQIPDFGILNKREQVFLPEGNMILYADQTGDEEDPDKQKKLYDYAQQPVTNPAQSYPWYELIRGAELNALNGRYEYGPNIPPDRYFRLAWKEWGSPGKSPVDKTWRLEDKNYDMYSKIHYFNSNSEFLPIHVSVQFAHRIASLPLLSHQLPTHQYLGPSDRMLTVTFFVTKAGKKMLERFQREIEAYEQNVIDYREFARNEWMEIKTPLAKAAHFSEGDFGYKVVPEHIDIETVPGNPGSSMVRVTFSEFNPSVFKEQESPADKEEKVIRSFIQGVFNKLSGGKPRDILYVRTNSEKNETDISLGGGGGWGDQITHGIDQKTRDRESYGYDVLPVSWTEPYVAGSEPWMELRLSMTEQQAKLKGMALLWEFANELLKLTHRSGGDPKAFAFATDEDVYGLKLAAELSLYWGGESLDSKKAASNARDLKGDIRDLALTWLHGKLASKFPALSMEARNVNLDLNACYPDMDLPPHPITGRVIDTEPDFYLIDQEIQSEADNNALTFAKQNIMPIIKRLVTENRQTDVDKDNEPVEIVELEKETYKQKGVVNMDNVPIQNAEKLGIKGDLKAQSVDIIDKIETTISDENIFDAGVESIKRDTRLGLKKAYPTFRLYFIRESKDEVTYSNFYEAQGGFAVREISVIRSRKIPADTCVISMVNLDGFLETNAITDIRSEDFRTDQARYVKDSELFDKHEQVILNQLEINNKTFNANIKYDTIRNIIDQVNENPTPGGSGPMGVTNNHAEIADGRTYSSSTLKDPVTNIRIGTNVVCKYAADMNAYQNESRFNEIVATLYRYPQYEAEIKRAVEENYKKNGLVTFEWSQRVRSTELNEYVETFRPQQSSESFVRREKLDKEIETKEKELEAAKKERERNKRIQGITPTPLPKPVYDREQRKHIDKVNKLQEEVVRLKRDREATAVRNSFTDGIIFKEGTDIVLKMGYSNNPENLDITFIGQVTEVQPGPGTLEIVAQSFATELMQEVKGVPNMDAILTGNVYPSEITNWILSHPEVRHFGRWEDHWEIIEDERNIKGVWYKLWDWTNNPSDDNIYLPDDYVGQHTINGRTLWQGLQDLNFIFPGYVMGVRPYRDLDRSGRRRWRNTFFMGRPDQRYLWWVPDDWNTLISEVTELKNQVYFQRLDVAPEVQLDTDLKETQKLLDDLNQKKAYLEKTRFEPFRRYHFLSSYHNIIDNGIILSKRNVYNAIRLNGMRKKSKRSLLLRKVETEEWQDLVERKLYGMDDENVNWLYVENDNAWGHRAQKMATSMLMWQLREIYQGEITILGDPNIRPYDVCFINDLYNDISGPVEVEQVVHTFSEEAGFITQITPDLITCIGEIAQRTAIGAMSAYSYRWLLNRMNIPWYPEAERELTHAYRNANRMVRGVTAGVSVLSIAGLTALYPLFMGPILLGGYFLGNYIKNHATIRVVPLFHKGYPFVTGLEGFEAPESANVLLNQYKLLRKGVSESIDAVSGLYQDIRSPRRRMVVLRKMIGL